MFSLGQWFRRFNPIKTHPVKPKPKPKPKPVPPPPDPRLAILKRLGIISPDAVLVACRSTGLSVALGAAVLIQESGGGQNVFGHDPTIYAGAGEVTEAKYLAYKRDRVASGNRLMQGVGPMQLTYWSYQDEADQMGGCWRPYYNIRVGFGILAANVRRDGLHAGVAAYNGSGPAAERYADTVLARMAEFERELAAT